MREKTTRATKTLSLRARALGYLARREHSRVELMKKLGAYGEPAEIEALVVDFAQKKWLSESRFVEQYVASKSKRYGVARMQQALSVHQVDDDVLRAALVESRGTELERAQAIWRQRFAGRETPQTANIEEDADLSEGPSPGQLREKKRETAQLARESALKSLQKQQRFLAARGFSSEVIRQVLSSKD